jgi:hypothetical protein
MNCVFNINSLVRKLLTFTVNKDDSRASIGFDYAVHLEPHALRKNVQVLKVFVRCHA